MSNTATPATTLAERRRPSFAPRPLITKQRSTSTSPSSPRPSQQQRPARRDIAHPVMRAQAPAPGRPIPLRAPPSLTDTMHTLESPLDPHFIGYAGKNQKKALVGGTIPIYIDSSLHKSPLALVYNAEDDENELSDISGSESSEQASERDFACDSSEEDDLSLASDSEAEHHDVPASIAGHSSPRVLLAGDVELCIRPGAQSVDEAASLSQQEQLEAIRLRLLHAFPDLQEQATEQGGLPLAKISIESERSQETISGEILVESRTPRYVKSGTTLQGLAPRSVSGSDGDEDEDSLRTPRASSMRSLTPTTADLKTLSPLFKYPAPARILSRQMVPPQSVWDLPIQTGSLFQRRRAAKAAAHAQVQAKETVRLSEFDQVIICSSCEGKKRTQCTLCYGVPPDEREAGKGLPIACVGCGSSGYTVCRECRGTGEYHAKYEVEVNQDIVKLPVSPMEAFAPAHADGAAASPLDIINAAKSSVAQAAQHLSLDARVSSPVAARCTWQSSIVRIVSVTTTQELRVFAVPADRITPITEITDDEASQATIAMVLQQVSARMKDAGDKAALPKAALRFATESTFFAPPVHASTKSPLPRRHVRFASRYEEDTSKDDDAYLAGRVSYPRSPMPTLPLSPSSCPRRGNDFKYQDGFFHPQSVRRNAPAVTSPVVERRKRTIRFAEPKAPGMPF